MYILRNNTIDMMIKTHPNGKSVKVIKMVGTTGMSNRSVFMDENGNLWVQDLNSEGDSWFSKTSNDILTD